MFACFGLGSLTKETSHSECIFSYFFNYIQVFWSELRVQPFKMAFGAKDLWVFLFQWSHPVAPLGSSDGDSAESVGLPLQKGNNFCG